jgi:hypothetical protein
VVGIGASGSSNVTKGTKMKTSSSSSTQCQGGHFHIQYQPNDNIISDEENLLPTRPRDCDARDLECFSQQLSIIDMITTTTTTTTSFKKSMNTNVKRSPGSGIQSASNYRLNKIPQSNLGKTNVVFTPDFFFPVRIPSILLDEHLQQSGKEFIEEIAIASHVNQIQ